VPLAHLKQSRAIPYPIFYPKLEINIYRVVNILYIFNLINKYDRQKKTPENIEGKKAIVFYYGESTSI